MDLAQVHGVVEEEPARIDGWACESPGLLDLAEAGGEARFEGSAADGEVVGVGVFEVGGEDHLGLVLANDGGEGVAEVEGGLEVAVGEVEEAASDAEDFSGHRCLAGAGLRVAVRRRLAVGDVEEKDVVTGAGELGDGAAHADLLIIRMRADDEDACHRRARRRRLRAGLLRCAARGSAADCSSGVCAVR